MASLLGLSGAFGIGLSIVLMVLLAIAPIMIAHALYQIAGALRLQAFVMAEKPDQITADNWNSAKRTPIGNIIGATIAGLVILVAAVVMTMQGRF